ncbi:MAG TPA: hypothetical protein VE133_06175, partial [Candidatus Sulfotelmatobacter sp.]|nr:hypothetical protein [Candidatus Sulfotelmatobacter sp.]
MAQPPQNSQTFAATLVVSNVPGCPAVTGTRAKTIWSASDPSVRLSTSESGQLNATCTTALPNPVTLTARQTGGEMLTAKATLVCQ